MSLGVDQRPYDTVIGADSNLRVFAVDECGDFPPRKIYDNPRITSNRLIICVSVADNPRFITRYRSRRERSAYVVEPAHGGYWTELNGVHSKTPELVGSRPRRTATQIGTTIGLLVRAGFRGVEGQRVAIDRFWPERYVYMVSAAFEYFGVSPEEQSMTALPFTDDLVPLGRRAHNDAKGLWRSHKRRREHEENRIDIPPEDLIPFVESVV